MDAKMNFLEVEVTTSAGVTQHDYHNFEINVSGALGEKLCHKEPYDDAFSIRRGGVSAVCNDCRYGILVGRYLAYQNLVV